MFALAQQAAQQSELIFGVLTVPDFLLILGALSSGLWGFVQWLGKQREKERAHELELERAKAASERDLLSAAIYDAGDRGEAVREQIRTKATPAERDELRKVKHETARRRPLT